MPRKSREVTDPEAAKRAEIEAAWAAYHLHRAPNVIHAEWLQEHISRQKGRCHYCKIVLLRKTGNAHRDRLATLDHVVPRGKGGEDTFENTVAACLACNAAKADMDELLFRYHPVRLARLKLANTPPDRLSVDPESPYYESAALERGVGVRFNGQERTDVREYSVSEGWIRIAAGKALDRKGRPVAVKLKGAVEPYYRNA